MSVTGDLEPILGCVPGAVVSELHWNIAISTSFFGESRSPLSRGAAALWEWGRRNVRLGGTLRLGRVLWVPPKAAQARSGSLRVRHEQVAPEINA